MLESDSGQLLPSKTGLYLLLCIAIGGTGMAFMVISDSPTYYFSESQPSHYILLSSDHTFQVYQGKDNNLAGTWIMESDKLFLNGAYYSFVLKRIDENKFIDKDNDIWTKSLK